MTIILVEVEFFLADGQKQRHDEGNCRSSLLKVKHPRNHGKSLTSIKMMLNYSCKSGPQSNRTSTSHLVKGKAIPLQAWTGPECSRRSRLPDFKTIGTSRW